MSVEDNYLFTNRINPSIELKINNRIMLSRESSKFVGVVMDRKLSSEMHVILVIKKTSMTTDICITNYKQNGTPKTIWISMYYSSFYPYLVYGNLSWGKNFHIIKLKLLQKQIMRIKSGAEFYSHTNPLFVGSNCEDKNCSHICVISTITSYASVRIW